MRVVITGGPGTGKSSIIESLKKMNFNVFNESSREVTKKYKNNDSEQYFLSNPTNFSNILMDKRKKQFEEGSKSKNDYFFYDRGIPDILAYLNFKKIEYKSSMMKEILKFNYDTIFIAEPWKAIYTNDSERYETYDELLEIDFHIKKIYKQLGYNIIILPKKSVKDRVTFILENLH
tara:strand:+ start:556 stop:1083 length:528 start_codon:yes stop_codon:yes gene_type:complete